MNRVYDAINSFCYKRSKVLYTDLETFDKLRDEFLEEIKIINKAEEEILNYYNNSIITGVWENEAYWAWAAITRPSEDYLECFSKVLQTNDSSFPHWRTLDVLAFMPKNLWPKCASIIERAIELDNPSWCEEDIKKAFEVLKWITDDGGREFIKKECNSKNSKVSNMARYWLFWPDSKEDE